jgi:hypothetical protein
LRPTMSEQTPPPPPAQAATAERLDELRKRGADLELRVSDLTVKASQLGELRAHANSGAIEGLNKQFASAQHDLVAATIELRANRDAYNRLEAQQQKQEADAVDQAQLAQLTRLQQQGPSAITLQPPPASPLLGSEQIMQLAGGGAMLMLPIVLVLARNLWTRGSRKVELIDIESSPRLMRIEQAVESISVEVERIGEAQRFTTKLLSERAPDVMINRAAVPVPRREPGTITPH